MSSLGHNVLIPALIGGSWARDLNVSTPESPYLAFIVGMHVATALAMIDLLLAGLGPDCSAASSPRSAHWQRGTVRWRPRDQILAWMLILATIPVGLAGLVAEHTLPGPVQQADPGRDVPVRERPHPVLAGSGSGWRGADTGPTRRSPPSGRDARRRSPSEPVPVRAAGGPLTARQARRRASGRSSRRRTRGPGLRRAAGRRGVRRRPSSSAASQILALLAGISRDGVTMVTGMARGLSREDAARFAFLLATPVILAAGVLKVPDLTGPLGQGSTARSCWAASRPGSALRVGPVPGPLLPDPHPVPVRDHCSCSACSASSTSARSSSAFRPWLFRTMGPARRAPAPWHPAD